MLLSFNNQHTPAIRLWARILCLFLALWVGAALLAGCSRSGGPSAGDTSGPLTGVQPVVVSADLTVGQNRLLVGLLDQYGEPLTNAQVHFRLFKLEQGGAKETLISEIDGKPLTIQKNYTHIHPDGKIETHPAGTVGVYIARVDFDTPGDWGLEITGAWRGRPLPTLTPAFRVAEKGRSVAVGSPAPHTVQTLLKDVKDISETDSSNPPDPHMHSMTIGDAVTSGKPTVIVFASPGFCISQICGPTKDVTDQLYEKHKGEANFIHVEPYDLKKARSGQALETVPAMREWGLLTEPWVFLVDKDGKVAAKFEGIVGLEELDSALTPLLAGGSSPSTS